MNPSRSQLGPLSPEDRIVYEQWRRGSALFYGSVIALLLVAAFANHLLTAPPSVAGDPVHTAAVTARK